MKYDKIDKRIIEALYHNWRTSSSQLGRKIHLSRRKVDYRIKGYFLSGVIRAIFAVFNYSSLGYKKPAYIFIRLVNKQDRENIGKYLESTKRCTSWGRAWTEYDIFSNFIFKDAKEKRQILRKLQTDYKNEIEKITIINPSHAEFYPLKSIGNEIDEKYVLTQKSCKKSSLDSIDIKILEEIATNARKPITEIAHSVSISPERCLYRLRRLVKEKVILGSRIQFGLKEAGYFATCLFVNAKLNNNLIEKMQILCKKSPHINYLIISEKDPQLILQVFHQDEESLHCVIRDAFELLANNLVKITLVKLEDDIAIVNPAPFLRRI